MKKITYVTGNWAKILSARQILEPLGYEVEQIKMDVPELQSDFIEDVAKYSAKWASDKLKCDVLKNDSGLCVDALKGAPGVYSARYSGGDDEDNNDLLLKELDGKDNRNAKYVCTMACVFPDHSKDFVVRGECYGKILTERHGDGGFGYDPLFYYEPFGKTFAEVELSKKNEVSHRAIAIKQFVKKLKQVLNDK
jgi:XTP/dITP diphosphohydrolase